MTAVTEYTGSKRPTERARTHQAGRSHSARQNASFRLFQKRNHLLTRNRWEVLKKLIDRIATFQVIHKILNWHTRPDNTWRRS
jgi:hypothetical protein